MSTIQTSPRVRPTFQVSLGTGLLALGVLVAVAVAILFLALPGSNHKASPSAATHVQPASAYTPLIQYRGTGAAPAINPETGQTHGAGPRTAAASSAASAPHHASGYIRAEHSYGAVP